MASVFEYTAFSPYQPLTPGFAMNIKKLSDEATVTTINEIADGLKQFVKENPDLARPLLEMITDNVLDVLNEDDFFGTEGWLHAFGIE